MSTICVGVTAVTAYFKLRIEQPGLFALQGTGKECEGEKGQCRRGLGSREGRVGQVGSTRDAVGDGELDAEHDEEEETHSQVVVADEPA